MSILRDQQCAEISLSVELADLTEQELVQQARILGICPRWSEAQVSLTRLLTSYT